MPHTSTTTKHAASPSEVPTEQLDPDGESTTPIIEKSLSLRGPQVIDLLQQDKTDLAKRSQVNGDLQFQLQPWMNHYFMPNGQAQEQGGRRQKRNGVGGAQMMTTTNEMHVTALALEENLRQITSYNSNKLKATKRAG